VRINEHEVRALPLLRVRYDDVRVGHHLAVMCDFYSKKSLEFFDSIVHQKLCNSQGDKELIVKLKLGDKLSSPLKLENPLKLFLIPTNDDKRILTDWLADDQSYSEMLKNISKSLELGDETEDADDDAPASIADEESRDEPCASGVMAAAAASLDEVDRSDLLKKPREETIGEEKRPEGALITSEDYNEERCEVCIARPKRKCRTCGCNVCGLKNDEDKQLVCDECDLSFHIYCLTPKLDNIPEGDWYCKECFNDTSEITTAGQELKVSKKLKQSKGFKSGGKDWGHGMATAARTKECESVPIDHFGKIPGVLCGSSWKYRVQVSETGIHRPPVAGIHGQEKVGAFSIVLSGGYEDDEDNGFNFIYTGSGGRDLGGNRRTAAQSSDQKLEKTNLALSKSCADTVVDEAGCHRAIDWKKSKPIRVVRNYKASKHSRFAPEEGNRYDGIYKLKRYWQRKGKSGFKVWQYEFERDDPEPAPWTRKGKDYIKKHNLQMEWPDQAPNLKRKSDNKSLKKFDDGSSSSEQSALSPPNKRVKSQSYTIPDDIMKLIMKDTLNERLWNDVQIKAKEGVKAFYSRIQENFKCCICVCILSNPVTLACGHSLCKACIERSLQNKMENCPTCRKTFEGRLSVNKNLKNALRLIYSTSSP